MKSKSFLLRYGGCLLALGFVISLVGYKLIYGYAIQGVLIVSVPLVFCLCWCFARFWTLLLIFAALWLQPLFAPVTFVLMSNARLMLEEPEFSATNIYGAVKTRQWGLVGFYSSHTELQLLFSEDANKSEINSAYEQLRKKGVKERYELKRINANYYLVAYHCC